METIAQFYRIRTGKEQEYVEAHQHVWPELEELMRGAGVMQMRIFLRGNLVFLFAEVEDRKEYERKMAEDPNEQRWDAWMAKLLEAPYDANEPGIFADAKEVYTMTRLQ